jgi:hypothetical protein
MNTTITLAVTTLAITLLSSCQSETEKLQQTAINEVKETLLDPKSFELIETEVDTIYASLRMIIDGHYLYEGYERWSKHRNKVMDDVKWDHALGRPAGSAKMRLLQTCQDSCTKYIDQYSSLVESAKKLQESENDSIVGYSVKIRYYATSRGGDKRMGENRYSQYNNGKTKLEDVSPLKDLSSL